MPFRLIVALLAWFAVVPAYAAERSYLVGSFEEVIVEGDIQVTLETGKAPSAKATGDKGRLAVLKIDRQDKVVRIRMQGLTANRKSGEPVKVALTGRNIRKLVLHGNGMISASVLDVPNVRIEIRGSGEIKVAQMKSERLVALLIGSGKLDLGEGQVTNGEVVIDGAPVITASGVEMDKLRLQQNGPASSQFRVKTTAEITNSGAGTITIDGKGTCLIRQAGSAVINCEKKVSP
jgi:hypothetical protein